MRLERSKRYRFVALVAVLALVLAACGDGRGTTTTARGSGSSTRPSSGDGGGGGFEIDTSNCPTDPSTVELTGDTIKLGTSLPQSGIYAAFAEILTGEQAYFDYLNETEGRRRDRRQEVQDRAGRRGRRLRRAARRSPTCSRSSRATTCSRCSTSSARRTTSRSATTCSENCVPNLFAGTGSPAWGNHDYPWLIGTALVPYPLEMQALVTTSKENKPDATIAMLRANDDFGASYSETLKELIAGHRPHESSPRRRTTPRPARSRRR